MTMKRLRTSAIAMIVLSLVLVGCSGETADTSAGTETESAAGTVNPPTKEEAAEIIQKAPEYSDFRFTSVTLSIPMQESRMHDQMKEYARDLERAGWLRVDSTGTVVLADKARQDNKWVERSNGFTDIAPLAQKEFVEVRSIEQTDSKTVNVDFTYRWNPNAAGAALQSGLLHETLHSPQYATATLENYGDGWQLYIIRSDETPPAEPAEDETEQTETVQ